MLCTSLEEEEEEEEEEEDAVVVYGSGRRRTPNKRKEGRRRNAWAHHYSSLDPQGKMRWKEGRFGQRSAVYRTPLSVLRLSGWCSISIDKLDAKPCLECRPCIGIWAARLTPSYPLVQ